MSDKFAPHFSGAGAVASLEERLRSHYDMPYALCVASATAGLLATALALDLRSAEFVTTPYTWGGSIASWILLGNRPRFADIDPLTLGLAPAAARSSITTRTRALLAVDIYGVPAAHPELLQTAREAGIWYVVDAAQSLGATLHGRASGSEADVVVVSFTRGKTVDAGEGGAVLTRHRAIYERLLWHSQHPLRQRLEIGVCNEFALNGRIHPAAAACAVCNFDRALDRAHQRTRLSFDALRAAHGSGCLEETIPDNGPAIPVFYRTTAAWKSKAAEDRLRDELLRSGFRATIEPAPVTLLYRQPAFRQSHGSPRMICPQAERQWRSRFLLAGLSRINTD